MNRRGVLLAALMITVSCATVPPPEAPARFKILQINDVYKIEGLEGGNVGGLARVRSLRKQLESDGTPVLILHGGDALYPSVMSKFFDAKPMVEILNLLDGDAAAQDPRFFLTFGNHELDKSDASVLLARLDESAFQWVTTNTLHCNPTCEQLFPKTTRTALVDAGGTKIGILGLLYPLKKAYVQSTDVLPAASAAVTELRKQGARVVIAVTHQEMSDDEKLVRSVPGIDLVIGGHDHLYMQSQVNGAWITKADADAKSAIVYDVTVPSSGPVRTTPLRIALDTTTPKDPVIDMAVQRWLTALSAKIGGLAQVGTTKVLLEGVEPAVRGRETALGNLMADAAREQMQADVAIVNGGSIRINDNIPPGPITNYDMEGIFYYANSLVAVEATGRQLLEMLNNSVSRVDAGDGRFLQVSGIAFRYGPDVKAEDVQVNGKPLDLNATYTIATTDFMYTRGVEDGYTFFAAESRPPKVKTDREADFRKTVEAYIGARGTITTGVEGRIVRK
jgi:2',3'-cyclic-nucleotide 2'-phosphodiesterase (5'-nucleotidase family)